jgi:hypothetical protein
MTAPNFIRYALAVFLTNYSVHAGGHRCEDARVNTVDLYAVETHLIEEHRHVACRSGEAVGVLRYQYVEQSLLCRFDGSQDSRSIGDECAGYAAVLIGTNADISFTLDVLIILKMLMLDRLVILEIG